MDLELGLSWSVGSNSLSHPRGPLAFTLPQPGSVSPNHLENGHEAGMLNWSQVAKDHRIQAILLLPQLGL